MGDGLGGEGLGGEGRGGEGRGGDGLGGDGLGFVRGGLVGLWGSGDLEGRGVVDGDVRSARERVGEGEGGFSLLGEDFAVGVLTGSSTFQPDPGGVGADSPADGVTASAPMDRLVRVGPGVGVGTAAAGGSPVWLTV